MKASITTNKKRALTDIAFHNVRIRIFVRDEPHYQKDPDSQENITCRALAKKLSTGFINSAGFDVPARPFMKQFRAENKDDIIQILKTAKSKGFKGWKGDAQYKWAAEQIRNRLMAFIYLGQVQPENSEYTLERKTGSTPLVDTTQLLYAIDAEVTRVNTKQ